MLREHKKFERLFLFNEVAKHISFSKAALALGISRGYLSEQIKALEKEYQRALLIRTTRSVKLTPQGKHVLSCMGNIKSTLLELERTLAHEHEAIAGNIRITAPSQFTNRYLLTICEQFNQEYPDVKFNIDCSYTPHNLIQSNYDIAFRSTLNPPQNMIAKKLFSYKQVCCASPSYIAKNGEPSDVEDLLKHSCLTSTQFSLWHFSDRAIELEGKLSINDNHMLKNLALQGQGIIYTPEYLVDLEINAHTLKPLLTQLQYPQSDVYLIHPQLINESARISHFIKFTTNWFRN